MPLTPKQQRFVEEYPIDLNATQAYIRAGYSGKGAQQSALVLLSNPVIAAALQKEQVARSERTGIEADQVVLELARVAFSKLTDAVTWDGEGMTLHDSGTLSTDVKAAVREVRAVRTIVRGKNEYESERIEQSIKFHDKLKALELLGRHLGMFQPGASDEPPDDQPIYWQRDPRSDLRIIDQASSSNGQHSNGAT